jgi:radical SAM protein with 4Fe4S-binding SPASM domain|tara:strand:+ start:891 stop:1796 length:906 start_codon:yes stop_codon:yes gene_type:complete
MNKTGHNNPPIPLDPKETIKKNINRRKLIVDDGITLFKGVPLPTWIELSLIDVCNRSCSFCPKSDDKVAPDTYQKMSKTLIDKLHDDLKKMNYKGSLALCGYGEPLLHKDIEYIVNKLSEVADIEIVTNGDPLNHKMITKLYNANAARLLISLYDGPEQIDQFKSMIKQANVPEDFVILRDRWYTQTENFGVKLTNRAGTIKTGNQIANDVHTTCYYPSYQFLIDWNGDVFLCPQDWQRRQTMGNMMQEELFDIWTSKVMKKYRVDLLKGKRCNNPCKTCNAQGTLLGVNHAKTWRNIYKI